MKYKIKSKKLLVDEYFKVEKAQVEFDQHFSDDRVEVTRFNLLRGFAVTSMLYHKEKDAIILVRQFRYSTAEAGHPWLVELPAGLMEKGEAPLYAAKRETIEETGYQLKDAIEISRFFVAPGCTDEQIILYYGEVTENDKITEGGGVEDEHEDIKLFYLPVKDIKDFLHEQTLDAKTIIGLHWFLEHHNK